MSTFILVNVLFISSLKAVAIGCVLDVNCVCTAEYAPVYCDDGVTYSNECRASCACATGCVEVCGTIMGLQCSETTDECVDIPDDGCTLGTDSDCAGQCQSTCPEVEPSFNDVCRFTGTCTYGEATCCGETYATSGCECVNGQASCWVSSFMCVDCETPTETPGCQVDTGCICTADYAPVYCDDGVTYSNECKANCECATGCVGVCGTIMGLQCSETDECVDIPDDGCTLGTDSDCAGQCQSTSSSICPVEQSSPNDVCDWEGSCSWGEETCCGVTYPSFVCQCPNGKAACYNTDSCMLPNCDTTTEEPSSSCPDVEPSVDDACAFEGTCSYEETTCCGETYSTFGCDCVDGKVVCWAKDFMCIDCDTTTPEPETPGCETDGNCICTADYAPVYCDDGVTYSNECQANCACATGCVDVCGTMMGLQCAETTDECVDIPDDDCTFGVDSDCAGQCQARSSSTCPVDQASPNDVCDWEGSCSWGEETCCGETYPSFVCECSNGEAACYNTDSCLVPNCDTTAEPEPTDTEDTICAVLDSYSVWKSMSGICNFCIANRGVRQRPEDSEMKCAIYGAGIRDAVGGNEDLMECFLEICELEHCSFENIDILDDVDSCNCDMFFCNRQSEATHCRVIIGILIVFAMFWWM